MPLIQVPCGAVVEIDGVAYEVLGAGVLFGHPYYKVKTAEMATGSSFGMPVEVINAAARQPAPLPADGPDIADLVTADIAARKAEGIRRYGTPLRANNGRDALLDAYQEALDQAVYLRQAIEERGKPAPGPDEPSIEMRYNEDDTLDEVVARGAFVHLEQLDDNCWWLNVRLPDGREAMLTLYSKRGKVRANVTEEPRP